jgi:hypothetical protein
MVRSRIVAVAATAVLTAGGTLLLVGRPVSSVTPCEVALAEAAELQAFLDHNAPVSNRQRRLEEDQRAFVAQVRARCSPPRATSTTAGPTTTTAPSITTVVLPTTTVPTTTVPTTTVPAPTTTTPPPGGTCLPDPSACGYPDAETTGVTGALTPVDMGCGDYLVADDGALIENLDIHGTLLVTGDNVTIRNVRVRTTCNFIAVALIGTGITFTDSEVDGSSTTGYGVGIGDGAVMQRLDIHHVTDGMTGDTDNWVAQDNWIHDLADTSGQGHFDGIQFDGGQSNIDIVHNTISIPADTGTVNIANNDGPTFDVEVTDNLLAGGTYTVYVDDQFSSAPITDIRVTNNRFGWHTFGYWFLRTPHPTIVFAGNVDDTTGQPL